MRGIDGQRLVKQSAGFVETILITPDNAQVVQGFGVIRRNVNGVLK
jgi:hypothetical protein